jgi:hypothetical protein
MSQKSSLSAMIQRLSPRERMLGGIALALTLVIGLIYGGLMPGMNAARSAATRNVDAAADLSVIRSLASSPDLGAPLTVDPSMLKMTAEAAGLVVVDQRQTDPGLTMTVNAPGPQAILSWLAANANTATIETFAIEPTGNGGVTASVRFSGGTS